MKPVVDVVVDRGMGMSPVVVDVVGEVGPGVVDFGVDPGIVDGGAVVGGTPQTQTQLGGTVPAPLVVTDTDGVVVEDNGIGD